MMMVKGRNNLRRDRGKRGTVFREMSVILNVCMSYSIDALDEMALLSGFIQSAKDDLQYFHGKKLSDFFLPFERNVKSSRYK